SFAPICHFDRREKSFSMSSRGIPHAVGREDKIMNADQIADLQLLDAELAKDSMRGLWAREEAIRREPAPFGKPMLWKWSKIRAGLEAAGRLITTNYKGARRAISLVHPNMSDSTS